MVAEMRRAFGPPKVEAVLLAELRVHARCSLPLRERSTLVMVGGSSCNKAALLFWNYSSKLLDQSEREWLQSCGVHSGHLRSRRCCWPNSECILDAADRCVRGAHRWTCGWVVRDIECVHSFCFRFCLGLTWTLCSKQLYPMRFAVRVPAFGDAGFCRSRKRYMAGCAPSFVHSQANVAPGCLGSLFRSLELSLLRRRAAVCLHRSCLCR